MMTFITDFNHNIWSHFTSNHLRTTGSVCTICFLSVFVPCTHPTLTTTSTSQTLTIEADSDFLALEVKTLGSRFDVICFWVHRAAASSGSGWMLKCK